VLGVRIPRAVTAGAVGRRYAVTDAAGFVGSHLAGQPGAQSIGSAFPDCLRNNVLATSASSQRLPARRQRALAEHRAAGQAW
jgi:nucleoside-diphosphate-sugar epimerase